MLHFFLKKVRHNSYNPQFLKQKFIICLWSVVWNIEFVHLPIRKDLALKKLLQDMKVFEEFILILKKLSKTSMLV